MNDSATVRAATAPATNGTAVCTDSLAATAAMDAAGIPLFAASMLEPTEIIVGLWRPSPWFMLLRSARSLLFIVLFTLVSATAAETSEVPWSGAVVQLGALLIVGRIVAVALDWGSRVYVLTDRRVLRRRGVLSPTVYSAELRKLRRIELTSSIWQRMLGLGTVTFSARTEGAHDAAWVMVARAAEIHALVLQTKQRFGK